MIARMTMYFAEREFVQAHPPVMSSSDCEGAGEVFSISAAKSSAASSVEKASESELSENDGRPRTKYLTVSSQLHLEALAQSVGRVWALAPTFRAERSDTSRHLSEFYMLEAEICFVDRLEPMMELVEDLLAELASDLSTSALGRELLAAKEEAEARDDGEEAHAVTARQLQARWQGMVQREWPRVTYLEAFRLLIKAEEAGDVRFEHRPNWHHGPQTEHERYIADVIGQGRPVFVTHYPRFLKPFYMAHFPKEPSEPSEPRDRGKSDKAVCFDLLVPDLCELAGGSVREHRLDRLLEQMQSRGLLKGGSGTTADAVSTDPSASDTISPAASTPDSTSATTTESDVQSSGSGSSSVTGRDGKPPSRIPHPLESQVDPAMQWYVDLRRWGSAPHAGFGLGFDRLLAYLAGVNNVKDVVTFPRWAGRGMC